MRNTQDSSTGPTIYETIVQQSLDAIIIVDGSSGHILQSNPALHHYLGYHPDDLLGKLISTILPMDDDITESDTSEPHRIHGTVLEMQKIRHADGTILPMDMTITTAAQDDHSVVIITLRDASARYQAEQQLHQARANLEQRIAERTAEIAERKRTEEALRTSEAHYRILAENMQDVVWVVDAERQMTYVSPSVQHLRGYTPEEVLCQQPHELVTPDSLQVLLERMQNPTGQSERIELEQPCKDGSTVWTESIIVPIQDANGMITGWVGVSRDVSERKQAEQQIRQNAARAEALVRIAARLNTQLDLDTILEAICDETRTVLNTPIAAIARYDEEQDGFVPVKATGLADRLVKQARPIARSIIQRLMQPSSSAIIVRDVQERPPFYNMKACLETRIRTVAGVGVIREEHMIGLLVVATTTVRAFTEDELTLLHGIADQAAQAITNARLFADVQKERALLSRRVAERTADLSKANAELARAVRAKDEFLANMSHELRTPLNAILGSAEALQEHIHGSINDRQHKALDMIDRSGRHLLSLINDILDLSKVEAGRIELEIEPVPIETVCHISLQFIKQQALKKNISVSLSIADTLKSLSDAHRQVLYSPNDHHTTIQADERRLKQILINLLTNAVKFTPDGGKVGLDVAANEAHTTVHFTVWDTGIGIHPHDQQRLFKPFIQIDSSLSRKYDGTGLGLALVRRLTELHGGQVALESEVGKGSRFTISLPWYTYTTSDMEPPAVTNSHTNRADQHSYAPPPTTSSPPQRVLLVEDSTSATEQLTRYLHDMGISQVIPTEGGHVADMVRQIEPDIIVLDLLLPNTSGWDILTALKASEQTRDIPVLIISVVDEQPQGLARGAAGYLVKPISRQQLQAAIQAIFPHFHPTSFASQAGDTDEASHTPLHAGSPPLILLAEDNDANRVTFSDYLRGSGYQVILARNGFEALERAREQLPDLILMDIQMPRMDGLEAIRRIRADTSLGTLPIIAITALAMPGDRDRCLAAGADDYLSKPVSFKALLQTIDAHLDKHIRNS